MLRSSGVGSDAKWAHYGSFPTGWNTQVCGTGSFDQFIGTETLVTQYDGNCTARAAEYWTLPWLLSFEDSTGSGVSSRFATVQYDKVVKDRTTAASVC